MNLTDNRHLTTGHRSPRPHARTVFCTYGGFDCCTDGAWHVTRTDSTGTATYETCSLHRDEAAAHASQYVKGWGTLTLTVEKVL